MEQRHLKRSDRNFSKGRPWILKESRILEIFQAMNTTRDGPYFIPKLPVIHSDNLRLNAADIMEAKIVEF